MGARSNRKVFKMLGKRKRSSYSNRPFKKPRYSGRGSSNLRKRLGRSQYNSTAGIGRPLRQELKYNDLTSTLSNTTQGWAATVTPITVSQGTGPTQRLGRKIWISSMMLHGEIVRRPTAAPSGKTATAWNSNRARLPIVQDMQCNGIGFAPSDLFQDYSVAGISAFRNLETAPRFKVFMDKTMDFNLLTTTDPVIERNPVQRRTVNKYIKFREPITVEFDGTMGVLTERRTNNLAVLLIWDRAEESLFTPIIEELQYTTRIRFDG